MEQVHITRLASGDRELAKRLFAMMSHVFAEECAPPSDSYTEELLNRRDFWAFAALIGGDVVGGVTAHALPMTRSESNELLIYDLAVRPDMQRRGIGRQLTTALHDAARAAGIRDVFVAVDADDVHALEFYRALGGAPARVAHFTFSDL